ncbi:MAG: gliding motility-associated C-terminal domain-containing protein, partial [Pelagibacterales bacterium]|nr:gliding motility-associated C-terminal domain-containing protein [Pelagibacterales bacterium]
KCPDEQIQIGLLPVNDPTITYFWFPSTNLSSSNVSNPFCDINSNQQYQLLVSNGSCTDTLFQNVLVTDLELDAGPDTSYCNIPILLSATFSSNVTSVYWSSNANFTDTLSSSSDLTIASVAVFYVKVSDGNCVQIDSVEILAESINIEVFANDICRGDSTFVGVTNLSPISPIISYSWNVNNLDTAAFIDVPDSSTWYAVEVINSEGCIIKDSVFVNVYPYPIIDAVWASDTIVFKGEEITLNVATTDNINWLDFSNSNPFQTLFPNETKCYHFEVFNSFNCVIKDSICIEVKDVFCDAKNLKIPTAFSPNEDDINDTYFIQDEDGIITNFKLEIFNRLGQKVFESSDISKEWDGTFRGKKLNPQVFDFYLELECIGQKKLFHKGNITLIR